MTKERLAPLLVDVRQAAQILGCGRTYVYTMLSRGDLPVVKLGRLTRVPVSALRAIADAGGRPAAYDAGMAEQLTQPARTSVEE